MTADDHVEFLRDLVAAVRCVPRHLFPTLLTQSQAMANIEGQFARGLRMSANACGRKADEAKIVRACEATWQSS